MTLSAIAYALPETRVTVEELARRGQIETPAARLREFGFDSVRVSDEPAETLAHRAVSALLTGTGHPPESVAGLFHAGAVPGSHIVSGPGQHVLEGFHY